MRTGWSCMNTVSHRRATHHPACPGTARPSTRGLLALLLVTGACGNRIEGEKKKTKNLVHLLFPSIRREQRSRGGRGLMSRKQNRGEN